MPYITMVFATILIGLGLVGYLTPSAEEAGSTGGLTSKSGDAGTDKKQDNDTENKSETISESENASAGTKKVTALIPALFGIPLLICGTLALKPEWLKHAMHGAAMIGLLGGVLGGGRFLMNMGPWMAGELSPSKARATQFVFLMTIVCLIFVGFCINSFIAARRARQAAESGEAAKP